MRCTLIIILSFLLVFGVAFASYFAFSNRSQALDYEDIVSMEKYLTQDSIFSGKFLCVLKGKSICDYKYYIEDNNLYLTLYAKAGLNNILPKDDDGYVTVSIESLNGVEKVYYRCGDDETLLAVDRK